MSEQTEPTFEGFAIVELMGHRRLAGYVREQEIFGAAFLRLDVPEHPWHEGCTCGSTSPGSIDHDLHNHACQMFRAPGDDAPFDVRATQFYASSAVYCLTPTTEEIARGVAARSRPQPVHRYELERPRVPAHDALASDHEDKEESF